MQRIHMPKVDPRYWLAIIFASIFGTNLGDFYAHESGLGIWRGLLVLILLAGLTFLMERRDRFTHEVYYWLVIIIIRTAPPISPIISPSVFAFPPFPCPSRWPGA